MNIDIALKKHGSVDTDIIQKTYNFLNLGEKEMFLSFNVLISTPTFHYKFSSSLWWLTMCSRTDAVAS